MKCFASLVILVLTSLSSVFAVTEVGRIKGSYYYRCYDDGTATFTGTTINYAQEYTIPAYVTYQGKNYRVTTVIANVFKGKKRTKINIDKNNTGLLLQKDAFNGMVGLEEFNIYSKNVVAELGAFDNIGNKVDYRGEGLPNTIEKYAVKYLNKNNLPVRKNYNSVSDEERMDDLSKLYWTMLIDFYNSAPEAYPHGNTVATVLFNGPGNPESLARLYRILAMAMGMNEKHVLVGFDNHLHNYFNYVLVNNNSGIRKWHVVDLIRYKQPLVLFKKEKDYIKYITNKRPDNYYDPKYFGVFLNKYNYVNETVYPDQRSMNFNTWLTNVGGGQRTL